jgi:hypothetical protein
MKVTIWILFCALLTLNAGAQGLKDIAVRQRQDTVVRRHTDTTYVKHQDTAVKKLNVEFTDQVLLFNAGLKKDSSGIRGIQNLVISGYVDVYYSYYSDSTTSNGYEKFPTVAPRSNAFGLNIAQITTKYASEKVRGIITLHYGDIPQSAWSPQFNMIQEANMGLALGRKVWLDAGFFRTHLGCESIQPRENINIGVALTTYFEPYYLSGAKLSYNPIPALMLQASVFNGFNAFVPSNDDKTVGFSATYECSKRLTAYYNVLLSNERVTSTRDKIRVYHDFFAVYKSPKIDAAVELNAGTQQRTKLSDSSKTATVISGTFIMKHKFTAKLAWFGRFEFFEDPDEILTGPVYNQYHTIVGINAVAGTLGFEIKPLESAYVRIEGRYLHLTDNEKIFKYDNVLSNVRYECLASMGFWF